MKTFIVLYVHNWNSLEPPLGFRCSAEDAEHAEEQCMNAYPEVTVVWVKQTNNYSKAFDEWITDAFS